MSSIVNKPKEQLADISTPPGQHLAAILSSKGSVLDVTHRPTPTPGPNDLLIAVKSIALNPLDWIQRDLGFAVTTYPAVVGSDIAGTVISTGSSLPSDAPQPGTRVAAFTPCFFVKGAPDYGGLQTRVLVPAAMVVPLPHGTSFNEASLLPIAVGTAWSGWYSIDVPRDTAYTPADKEGMLVWGGASSNGSAAMQIAKLMGFTVYATASEKHHEYLKGLGASKMFDYKSEDVVASIVKAARDDGVTIRTGYDAVGQLQSCLDILKEFKGEGTAKLASATPLSEDSPTMEGVQVKFVAAPLDEKERTEFFHFVFRVWLKEKLETGEFVPSPKVRVVEGGLEAANKALDELKEGVSGLKLVLEV
jgi:NADPH:quinone reductase-like Zn-dependent oxidoreductase